MGIIQNLLSKNLVEEFRSKFRQVEHELNDHLESVNANTNEIQCLYEMMSEMSSKLDKLNSRIDDLQVHVDYQSPHKYVDVHVKPLTKREREIFVALYTHDGEQLTYAEIAKIAGYDEVIVQEYITNLIAKGIPISKKFQNSSIFVSLDREFKELQAKQKIIKLV